MHRIKTSKRRCGWGQDLGKLTDPIMNAIHTFSPQVKTYSMIKLLNISYLYSDVLFNPDSLKSSRGIFTLFFHCDWSSSISQFLASVLATSHKIRISFVKETRTRPPRLLQVPRYFQLIHHIPRSISSQSLGSSVTYLGPPPKQEQPSEDQAWSSW
jgi:hypothetical protein